MYKSIFAQGKGNNKHLIHLWDDNGYHTEEWYNVPYKECNSDKAKYTGLKGENLCKAEKDWSRNDPGLHFHDIAGRGGAVDAPLHLPCYIIKFGSSVKKLVAKRRSAFCAALEVKLF